MLIIHNDIRMYTFEERAALEAAFAAQELKAQGGELSIDETRIRVAYTRLQREENFKIFQPTVKVSKAKVKEPKSLDALLDSLSGESTDKPKRVSTRKTKALSPPKEDNIARASRLWFLQKKGEVLSPEDAEFLALTMAEPEVL